MMATWRHNISWSKMKDALECPYRLQLVVSKAPHPGWGANYWMELGKAVQKIFELYFNQRINLKGPDFRTQNVLEKVTDKVMASPYYQEVLKNLTFPNDQYDEKRFNAEVREQVVKGRDSLDAAKFLHLPLNSEKKWVGRFRDIGLFAMTDFTHEADGPVDVIDGKGHQQMNADPRQVVHYALCIASTGRKLGRGALLYWRYGDQGVVDVDISPAALRRYQDEALTEAAPTIRALKQGTTEDLPAKPSNSNCYRCNYKANCKYSFFKKELHNDHSIQTVQL